MADHQDDARRTNRVTRRNLLGGGATLGVAAAVGAAGGAAEAGEPDQHDDPKRLTYRETDHIRAFYRRSRI